MQKSLTPLSDAQRILTPPFYLMAHDGFVITVGRAPEEVLGGVAALKAGFRVMDGRGVTVVNVGPAVEK